MELNSKIYECSVMHHRIEPKKNNFNYNIYTFAIDLDEIDTMDKKLKLFSKEKWNLFSFYRKDHLNFGLPSLKEDMVSYVRDNGCTSPISRVVLITNLRVLGYVFNPVCFYYFYNPEGKVVCAVAEVHNTFGEMKPFYFDEKDMINSQFFSKMYNKYFYVSPFQDLETAFEFRMYPPHEKLRVEIDDWKDNKKVFISAYRGRRKTLSSFNLLRYFFKYPLVTLRVIVLIHYQALILYLKKIPYYKKLENIELQKGVYVGKNSNERINAA